jgi:hypothetical protein
MNGQGITIVNDGTDYMNFLDTLEPIYTIYYKEYFNVTQEQLEQSNKEVTRKSKMEILSQMDVESREKLRNKKLQVYSIKNNVPQAPPNDPIFPRPRPLIPSNDKVPPQPTFPKNDEIDLNIDMTNILGKVSIHVPLT